VLILSLVEKPTDSEPGIRMIEDFGKGRAFPGQRCRAGQGRLVALEVPEPEKSPLTRIKTCCHKRVSAILWVDRRVHVDVGIR